MQRGTKSEAALPASSMHIDDDIDFGKNTGLHKVCDSIRDCSAWIARKSPIHVDVVKRRNPLIGGTRALAQLRHQDHSPADLVGIEFLTQALDRNLPLPLIPVRSSERGQAPR